MEQLKGQKNKRFIKYEFNKIQKQKKNVSLRKPEKKKKTNS